MGWTILHKSKDKYYDRGIDGFILHKMHVVNLYSMFFVL